MKIPIITLTNGLKVGNFSSPYEFKFVDGSILPRVDPSVTTTTALNVKETERETKALNDAIFSTVKLTWATTPEFILHLMDIYEEYRYENIDICLMPLPAMTALKQEWSIPDILNSPFRVIRVADREIKEILINKFCV